MPNAKICRFGSCRDWPPEYVEVLLWLTNPENRKVQEIGRDEFLKHVRTDGEEVPSGGNEPRFFRYGTIYWYAGGGLEHFFINRPYERLETITKELGLAKAHQSEYSHIGEAVNEVLAGVRPQAVLSEAVGPSLEALYKFLRRHRGIQDERPPAGPPEGSSGQEPALPGGGVDTGLEPLLPSLHKEKRRLDRTARKLEAEHRDAVELKNLMGAVGQRPWRSHSAVPGLHAAMLRANDLLQGHGVEPISDPNSGGGFAAEYVNTGDTYDATILYDYGTGRFLITSWGDWYEGWERRNGRHE